MNNSQEIHKPKLQVIVLRGISGAGKSTYARRLASQSIEGARVSVVSADNYFMHLDGYKFVPQELSQAHAACFRSFMSSILLGIETVVVDNTSLTASEISPYMLAASAYGYDGVIHQLHCEPTIAYGRSIHGVSPERTVQMARAFESEKLLPWWSFKLVSSPSQVGASEASP